MESNRRQKIPRYKNAVKNKKFNFNQHKVYINFYKFCNKSQTVFDIEMISETISNSDSCHLKFILIEVDSSLLSSARLLFI